MFEARVSTRLPSVCQKYRMRRASPPLKPRPVDHVGIVGHQRGDHSRVLAGVVLEVGVLDDHVRLRRLLETDPQRRAFALVDGLREHPQPVVLVAAEDLERAVRRRVVDRDHLADER